MKVHHLKTYLMGHATANQLSDKLLSAIHDRKLPLERLMMLGRDGPNVNKAVFNIMNKCVFDVNKHGLVDIGTCVLHVVHNAFVKGLPCYGNNISDLVIDVHQWFKLSPARQEDYAALQVKQGVPVHKFLKHVPCRWLALRAALNRFLAQWSTLCVCFLTELPKMDKSVEKNAWFLRIKIAFQLKETIVNVHFLFSISKVLADFL